MGRTQPGPGDLNGYIVARGVLLLPVDARGLVVATTSLGTIEKWSPSSWQDAPELLTARDLEALLKIDVKTIYSYAQRGLIPYVKIQSNVRFPKSSTGSKSTATDRGRMVVPARRGAEPENEIA